MRLTLVVVLAATALIVPAGAVAAVRIQGPTPAQDVAVVAASGHIVSDGARYVAFMRRGTLALYDTKRRRILRTRGRCSAVAAQPVAFLLSCRKLLDPRTRRRRALPGLRPGDIVYRLGRHWALGEVAGTACGEPRSAEDCTVYVAINWRTGERRECSDSSSSTQPCPLHGWNPDSKALRGHTARSVRFVESDPPYAIERPGSEGLVLRRGSRTRVLSRARCCALNLNPALSAGWVTWTERFKRGPVAVMGYSIATQQRHGWAVRGVPRAVGLAGDRIRAWHTRHGVFVSTLAGFNYDDENRESRALSYRLHFARWPGA